MANKNKLQAAMGARNPHKVTDTPAATTPPTITPIDLTKPSVKPNAISETIGVKPNGLKAVRKHRRAFAKDATSQYRTQRHAFEITVELKQQLKEAVAKHRAATGKKTSESQIIRTAITRYLKGEL